MRRAKGKRLNPLDKERDFRYVQRQHPFINSDLLDPWFFLPVFRDDPCYLQRRGIDREFHREMSQWLVRSLTHIIVIPQNEDGSSRCGQMVRIDAWSRHEPIYCRNVALKLFHKQP